LPHRPEHSDGAHTLPTPELNPLLNPVLGQNMSRWAEVYFSSAPEKRDQAVLELLRELEAENSMRASASDDSPSSVQEPALDGAQFAEGPPPTNRCQNCGRINPATHRFCGMCGKPVAPQTASSDLHVSDLHVADLHVADPYESPCLKEPAPLAPNEDSRFIPPSQSSYQQTPLTRELPLFQDVRGIDYSADHSGSHRNNDTADYGRARDAEIFAYAAPPRSYRLYVGLALVTFFLGLAYLAWRTMQTTHVESLSLPPAAAQPSESTEAPATPSTAARPQPAKPSTQPTTVLTPAAKRAARIKARKDARAASRAKARAALSSAPSTAAHSSPAPATTHQEASPETMPGTTQGNGAEELAMAENYLNGTNGQERNHAEAAKWLWKSMSKHNSDATLALSDLYLKGDGVSKSCDQARVLLDAAARKGVKEAGERLRHLPAFGCQ
jgi:hypothetical protein